ncbi:pilus assembly protein TadG-related protein [Demequina globuliformis]|uniref:pilus assembly protein TadG-related protein n=1 Tax=Demequina globuliformis TaxID=676202 RepID=UPI000782F6F6|nr:pilus assembly protein TadG-related protein [Demequina globuliformis]
MTRGRVADDAGSISVLSLGWVVVVLVAALTVAVVSDVHVQRTRLAALADGIVLEAVGAGSHGYYEAARGSALTSADVAAIAAVRTTSGAPSRWSTTAVVTEASAPDQQSARVTLARTVPLLFGLDALAPWSDGVTISASATARST